MITSSDYKNIKAIFQGKDGSLGYRNNRIYELLIYKTDNGSWLVNSTGLEQGCVYDSERAFLKNWMTSRKMLIEKTGHPTLRDFV